MVRATLVDSQCDFARTAGILNALSPTLQVVFDSLDFFLESGSCFPQFDGFFRILRARTVNLPPEFGRGREQFPHGCFGPSYFINGTIHSRGSYR